MVRLREVAIIKDPSLLNEKLGPFKIKKLLPLALGGMVGYGMIRKGTLDDIVIGIIVIVASLIVTLGPDRSLSFENQLQAMIYYFTLKSKGLRVNTQQPQQTIQSLKPEELEIKITRLKQQMKSEKDIIKKTKIKRELLSYELQYYTSEINNVEQRIGQLKAKMKGANKVTRSKISTKLRELYKKRSELYKLKNKVNAELRKFEKITLIDNEEINDLKKKVTELKSQIETTTDKKKLKELKEQYNITMLEYYNKKILQDKSLLKLVNDKALKSKINAELKELYKKKSELEKKLKKSKIGTGQTSSGGIVKIFKFRR
jgi:DNA repair exonuclease SbcCD ATPase subunit